MDENAFTVILAKDQFNILPWGTQVVQCEQYHITAFDLRGKYKKSNLHGLN